MTGVPRLRLLFAVLLIAATAALAVGMLVERAGRDQHALESTESNGHTESGASTEGEAAENSEGEAGETGGEERLFGIDTESPATIAAAVAASLLMAAAVWWRPRRGVFAVGALFCLGAAIFDIREVVHQAGEDLAGLAALAVLVAALHLAAGAVAAGGARAASTTAATAR
jgi:hypothetical protein